MIRLIDTIRPDGTYPHSLKSAELAKVCNWPTTRMRRWLKMLGLCEKRGREFLVLTASIRTKWPELWETLHTVVEVRS